MLRALISVSLLHQYVYIILPHILCFLVQAMFCAGPTSPKSVWKVHLLHQYQTPVQSQTLIKESAYNLFPKKKYKCEKKNGVDIGKDMKGGWVAAASGQQTTCDTTQRKYFFTQHQA